jgi:DNA-damage-inducible protein J
MILYLVDEPFWGTFLHNTTMATKTEYIRARVEPGLKARTERIFSELGMTTSDAIVLFLNQVSMKRGIPFDLSVSEEKLATRSTKAQGAKTAGELQARLKKIYGERVVDGDAIAQIVKERYDPHS